MNNKLNKDPQNIRSMFSRVAEKYDLLNRVLSLGTDIYWRRKAVQLSEAKLGDSVLDCCCGSGDLTFEFAKKVGEIGKITGSDFTPEMIILAKSKSLKLGIKSEFIEADATDLPFKDNSFDISSVAYGIRNVNSVHKCLEEMTRVIRSGGRIVVLEFGRPKGTMKLLFAFYSRIVVPTVAWITKADVAAYSYLIRSSDEFPHGEKFIELMKKIPNLKNFTSTPVTFGISYIYTAEKY